MVVFWIIPILEILSYTLAANGQCTSSTNIVPVCTSGTGSYKNMYIPVNGGMVDGCICEVTLVESPSGSNTRVLITNEEDAMGCGYKVVNYNTPNNHSWTCSNNGESLFYGWSLNESFQLTFTRDPTPEPSSTGFCLRLTTLLNTIERNTAFTITCWRNDATAPTRETTTPQITVEETTTSTPNNVIPTASNVECASSTNIVPVCTNSTVSYKQMNIPVNGGIEDGCQCNVTLVETSAETGKGSFQVLNMVDEPECGYHVVYCCSSFNVNWTSSERHDLRTGLSLNESFQLTFTSDSTPVPSSPGFCLRITTTINNIDTNGIDNRFTITCWRNDATTTTSSSTSQITIEQTRTPTTTNTTTTSQTIPRITTNTKTTSQTIPRTTTNPKTTSRLVTPDEGSTDRTPVDVMTTGYMSTEQTTSTLNNVLPSGIAVGVSFGYLVLIIIIVILVCIIRRKDKLLGQYVSRSDTNHPDNMYDVMTPREDNHHYEMSPARDSNATAGEVQPSYDVIANRSPENNYLTLLPPVNDGVYVNQ